MIPNREPIKLRKVRDFSGNISITFDFLRENFIPLYKNLFMIAGGIMIISYTIGFGIMSIIDPFSVEEDAIYQDDVVPSGFGNPFFDLFSDGFLTTNSILIPLIFFISILVVVAITYRYLLLYPVHGKEINPGFLWKYVKRDLWSIFLGTVLLFVLSILFVLLLTFVTTVMGWFVALIAICIFTYVIVPFSLIHIIILAEKLNPIEAIKRSLYLIKDKWLSTFGVIFITSLIIYIISIALYMPFTIVGAAISFNSLETGNSLEPDAGFFAAISIAITIVYSMSFFLSMPVTYLALAFQYFSIVEEKEHIGLIARIETIGEKI